MNEIVNENAMPDATGLVLDGQSGCGIILVSICFFQLLHRALHLLPVPRAVTALANTNQSVYREFRWRNLLVSYIHASITGVWACFCLYHYHSYFWEDSLNNVNWCMYSVSCFATGYFIYDTLDILLAKRIWEKWEILVHHIAIVCCALYVILQVTCVGYLASSMVIEVNTVFLHGRKLLQMAAVPRTNWFLRINRSLNLITFLTCRFGPLLVLTYGIVREFFRMPLWFMLLYFCSIVTLNVVNVILFWRLFNADVWPTLRQLIQAQGTTNVFERKHRKMDSTAGMCGSLNIQEDYAGGDCSSSGTSRIPSNIDLTAAINKTNSSDHLTTLTEAYIRKSAMLKKLSEPPKKEYKSILRNKNDKDSTLFKLGEEADESIEDENFEEAKTQIKQRNV